MQPAGSGIDANLLLLGLLDENAGEAEIAEPPAPVPLSEAPRAARQAPLFNDRPEGSPQTRSGRPPAPSRNAGRPAARDIETVEAAAQLPADDMPDFFFDDAALEAAEKMHAAAKARMGIDQPPDPLHGTIAPDPQPQAALEPEGHRPDPPIARSPVLHQADADVETLAEINARCGVLRIGSPLIAAAIDRGFDSPMAERNAAGLDADTALPQLLAATLSAARLIARSLGMPEDGEIEAPKLWQNALLAASQLVAAHFRATGRAEPPPGLSEMAEGIVGFASQALRSSEGFGADHDPLGDDPAHVADDAAARAALMIPCPAVYGRSQRFSFWQPFDAYVAASVRDIRAISVTATARMAGAGASDASRLALFRTTIEAATQAWVASHNTHTRSILAELEALDEPGKAKLRDDYAKGRIKPGVLLDCQRYMAQLVAEATQVSFSQLAPLLGGGQPEG